MKLLTSGCYVHLKYLNLTPSQDKGIRFHNKSAKCCYYMFLFLKTLQFRQVNVT